MPHGDVGVCYHEIKAHFLQELGADGLPYGMDDRHKSRGLYGSVRRFKLAYPARKIRVPDLKHIYFRFSFMKSS